MGWNKVSHLDECTRFNFFHKGSWNWRELYQFGYSQVGAVVCLCVGGISGCVVEIPQYKVHIAEIWEKGAESGTFKRW